LTKPIIHAWSGVRARRTGIGTGGGL
jgi:hypothetical protein